MSDNTSELVCPHIMLSAHAKCGHRLRPVSFAWPLELGTLGACAVSTSTISTPAALQIHRTAFAYGRP